MQPVLLFSSNINHSQLIVLSITCLRRYFYLDSCCRIRRWKHRKTLSHKNQTTLAVLWLILKFITEVVRYNQVWLSLCLLLIAILLFVQTSNTLTWTFHLLSKNPQIQDTLYKEVSTFVPADRIPSAEEITRMPYLRAVIKEALRWVTELVNYDAQWRNKMHKHDTRRWSKLQCPLKEIIHPCFAGCTLLFLLTQGSFQTRTFPLVDINFQRKWVSFLTIYLFIFIYFVICLHAFLIQEKR